MFFLLFVSLLFFSFSRTDRGKASVIRNTPDINHSAMGDGEARNRDVSFLFVWGTAHLRHPASFFREGEWCKQHSSAGRWRERSQLAEP